MRRLGALALVSLGAAAPAWTASAGGPTAEALELRAREASFEDWRPGRGAWEARGDVRPADAGQRGFFGAGAARLGPGGRLAQEIRTTVEVAGERLEAGIWVRFEEETGLRVGLELSLSAVTESGGERVLARARLRESAPRAGDWRYLETEPSALVGLDERALRLELVNLGGGAVAVDFVQLGRAGTVDGHPRRRVGANYVGRYRSPRFGGCTTEPSSSGERWRNWSWTAPPACDPDFLELAHDPDGGPAVERPGGRRDLAIGTSRSSHELPLIGAYDSRDPAVLELHLELAAAAGIDHLIYDHQGLALGLQTRAQGREAINLDTFDALVEVAEVSPTDVKLALMVEPKVHLLGWVQGQPTFEARLLGFAEDLVALALQMRGKRCALRHDGRLVVFVFRSGLCQPGGACLDTEAWAFVRDHVLARTGEELLLVADAPTEVGSVLEGLTRWQLVRSELLRYRRFEDLRLGVPSLPAPELASLRDHARALAQGVEVWRAESPAERIAIHTVWPGFDDSGVAGWGQPNLTGEDGESLCVRVASDFEGAFYATTVDAALEQGAEWIQVATFNDWNEGTQIEPAWHPELHALLPRDATGSAAADYAFARLRATRQWVEAFKGRPSGGRPLAAIVADYLGRARLDPALALYD